jgi:hypothetical protein
LYIAHYSLLSKIYFCGTGLRKVSGMLMLTNQ